MLEILAPAGNAQCAQAAINNGANAIYLGYSAFSARQGAENFELDSLLETVRHAHFCGVCVYVAMNTIVKDAELASFFEAMSAVWSAGVDAIILQDALLGKAVKQHYPEIVLHLSTQAGVCTQNGAIFAKECGFSRVILARETPLSEIEKITKIIETEVFVQGALCTCFSGQCYFSSFAGGNSGNRGRCKQPCRKRYSYNRLDGTEKNYALSLSDLCVGDDIQKYINAGVTSFKIEGRMRRAEYVAAAVRYYRALLDEESIQVKNQRLSDLKRTYNRGNYTKGLAFGQDKRFLSTAVQGHIGEKLGVVKVVNGTYCVESNYQPKIGDAFKILREGEEVGGAIFTKSIQRGFSINSKMRLKNGDGVFITTDTAVNERVLSTTKKARVSLRLKFHENDYAVAEACGITLQSTECLQSANTRALTQEELRSCFAKTDGLPIDVHFEEIDLQGDIFIAKSALNAFRREFYNLLAMQITLRDRKPINVQLSTPSISNGNNEKIAVIADDFTNVTADVAICKLKNYQDGLPSSFLQGCFEKYLYYPAFCTEQEEATFASLIQENALDGIYVENYAGLIFAKTHHCKIFAGTGLHLINSIAIKQLLSIANVCYYALSKECKQEEMAGLLGEKAFVLSSGNLKIMDLCYCPFGKACTSCDKKDTYILEDENGRKFPVRRYVGSSGNCRFEVYNCADLVGIGAKNAGKLLDCMLIKNKCAAIQACEDENAQKQIYENYTSGHYKRGVL